MKKLILSILFLLFFSLSCKENPTNCNQNSIIGDYKTIYGNFVFHRDSLLNRDTLKVTFEGLRSDIYVIIDFFIDKNLFWIDSTSNEILYLDSTIIKGIDFKIGRSWSQIFLSGRDSSVYKFEIERKNDGELSYSFNNLVLVDIDSTADFNVMFEDATLYNTRIFYYRIKEIYKDSSFKYILEAKIEVLGSDFIVNRLHLAGDDGLIKYDGGIAPDTGYVNNLSFDLIDMIYFKNYDGNTTYGRIKFKSLYVNDSRMLLVEPFKNLNYNLSYEIFLQTSGARTFF